MALPAASPPPIINRPIPMTFEEFLAWSDEGQSEWVDGWGTRYMSNSTRHDEVLQLLNFLLQGLLLPLDRGRVYASTTLMRLPSRPAGRMPDIFVVLNARRNAIRDQWLEGPADLAIEILSADSLHRDLEEKLAEYEAARIPEYLVADGRKNESPFLWHQLGSDGRYRRALPDADGRVHSRIIPGFWLDPRCLREDPLPNAFALLQRMALGAFARRLAGDDA